MQPQLPVVLGEALHSPGISTIRDSHSPTDRFIRNKIHLAWSHQRTITSRSTFLSSNSSIPTTLTCIPPLESIPKTFTNKILHKDTSKACIALLDTLKPLSSRDHDQMDLLVQSSISVGHFPMRTPTTCLALGSRSSRIVSRCRPKTRTRILLKNHFHSSSHLPVDITMMVCTANGSECRPISTSNSQEEQVESMYSTRQGTAQAEYLQVFHTIISKIINNNQ